MYLIDTGTESPYFNIASEEYFFREMGDNLMLLYINSPSIIVGKHQNVYEEINLKFVKERSIPVIRRISGGGTVYHDPGNLNFTFMVNTEHGKQVNFNRFISPVNKFLEEYGIIPEVGKKNEVRAGGLKFSGNAEHVFRNRVMHHGTILFSSVLEDLGSALLRGSAIFKSRSVQSNRTSVGNIGESIRGISSAKMLKKEMFKFMESYFPGSEYKNLSDSDRDNIMKLAERKYMSWEWNYGYGPPYELSNQVDIEGRDYDVMLKVEKGVITDSLIFSGKEIHPLSLKMRGLYHRFDDISKFFRSENINIDIDNLLRFFW